MRKRPLFDPLRASFLLVATVIGVQCAIVMVGVALCAWRIVNSNLLECDASGRLGDLQTGALAVALAFSGALRPKPVPDPPC